VVTESLTERWIVVVTGMSGAGRTTALHVFEDLAFYCIDNLPTPLIPHTLSLWANPGRVSRLAMGVDVRVREFLDGADGLLQALRAEGAQVSVLFLDAADEALVRRYSESRRPHPLASQYPAEGVQQLIARERERLAPLRAQADRVIDTTRLTVHDLRRLLLDLYVGEAAHALRMTVRVVSFGFKYGLPGRRRPGVRRALSAQPPFCAGAATALGPRRGGERARAGLAPRGRRIPPRSSMRALDPLLPRYAREGKVVLTVAVGCTGGRHRSVALAEALGERLREAAAPGDVRVSHRRRHRPARRVSGMERAETFEVINELGLHARPATRIVQTASRYRSEVTLERDGQTANAKSVMGVLLLLCHKGSRVDVRAQRRRRRKTAVTAIGALFASRFGEGK
jgi:UPF0042 nucleotide-binding protein